MFAPRKTEHERQHAAPASSLRERRQRPAPNQRRQARIMPPPPNPAARNQFIAPVGGGRSHIHPNNDGFSHQGPEWPHRPQHHAARPRAWGFGSIRDPITACRRRVAPLMLQFPPDSHIQSGETRRNRPPQPAPHHATQERRTPARTSLHRTRTPQQSNTIRRFKPQRTDSYRTRIYS